MLHEVTIAAVGDIMLGDSHFYIGHGVRGQLERKKSLNPFEAVNSILKQSSLVVGNLEGILSDAGLNKLSLASRQYRGSPNFATFLSNAGFSVLTTANNHILDHGEQGLRETESIMRSLGVQCVGIDHREIQQQDAALVLEVEGVKIGFLAYCLNREPSTHRIVPRYDEVTSSIQKARELCDRVILSLHWGDEFVPFPSPSQRALARSFVEAGADVILGHHPHVLQGVEYVGESLVAYSLGNFVFDQDWDDDCRRSMILNIRFGKTGQIRFEPVPISINDHFQPMPLHGLEASEWHERFEDLMAGLKRKPLSNEEYSAELASIQKTKKRFLHKTVLEQMFRLPPHLSLQLLFKPIMRYARAIR